MLTGLKTEFIWQKDMRNVDFMEDWLGTRVNDPTNPRSYREIQPPLFALNTDGSLRLLWVNVLSKHDNRNTYIVKDCMATNEEVILDENADPEGLNVQWSAQKLYDNTIWFVRMDPTQDLFPLAELDSALAKLNGNLMEPFIKYWAQ